jgi:hypothetical protein
MPLLSHLLALSLATYTLFFSKFAHAATTQQQCYALNGTELDSTYKPCDPSAKHSGCCGTDDLCLDNSLCMATSGQYTGSIWQTGCTDPTGNDEACPKVCPDGTSPLPAVHLVSEVLQEADMAI